MNKQATKTKHAKQTNYTYPYALREYHSFKNAEKTFNYKLKHNTFYIIRFDGKEMTKDYKIKKRAINPNFFDTMKETFIQFCSCKKNILFGYCFSDEISILIQGNEKDDPDDLRVEKILSLYASELSLKFYKNASIYNLKLKRESLFDARIIEIQENMTAKYFIARQSFAIIKYLSRLKTEHNIDQKYESSFEIIHELKKKNIQYYNLPKEYRYGLYYCPKGNLVDSFEFNKNKNKLKDMLN